MILFDLDKIANVFETGTDFQRFLVILGSAIFAVVCVFILTCIIDVFRIVKKRFTKKKFYSVYKNIKTRKLFF